eukprot:gene5107-10220_t
MEFLAQLYEKIIVFYKGHRGSDSDINDEQMEEYRMLSGFDVAEISRLRKVFLNYTKVDNKEELLKEDFISMPVITENPLQDRICVCFGYNEKQSLDFRSFLIGVSSFNSLGNRDQKLKIAFRLQDFDDDNMLSKLDLQTYLQRVTGQKMSQDEMDQIIKNIQLECSLDEKGEMITLSEFQRVVAPTDFQAKLHLPL